MGLLGSRARESDYRTWESDCRPVLCKLFEEEEEERKEKEKSRGGEEGRKQGSKEKGGGGCRKGQCSYVLLLPEFFTCPCATSPRSQLDAAVEYLFKVT